VSETRWNLYLPPLDLNSAAAIEVEDAGSFEFEGDPYPVRDLETNRVDHVEALVRRIE
jgi:hypothetical protein